MPFAIALSGLNAASADLGVTANNVANVNTTGFKMSRAQFSEVFAVGTQSVSSSAAGSGVRLSAIAQQFTQGNIDFTDNALDLAIGGEGFFVISDNGARSYTRAGAFGVDNQGYVVNAQGAQAAGVSLRRQRPVQHRYAARSAAEIGANPPAATTRAAFGINLPADAPVPANPVFDADRSEQLQPHDIGHGVRLARCGAYRDGVLHQGCGAEYLEHRDSKLTALRLRVRRRSSSTRTAACSHRRVA